MTTEQKLSLFTSYALEQAKKKQEDELNQYENHLREELENKKEQYKKDRILVYQKKEDQLKIDLNKKLSDEMNRQRLDSAHQKEQKTSQLFEEVKKQLHAFKATNKYKEILKEQIQSVQMLAGTNAYKIYLDSSDSALIPELEKSLKIKLNIAKQNLIGGTLSKIPSLNLLIDETIRTKLQEAKESFTSL